MTALETLRTWKQVSQSFSKFDLESFCKDLCHEDKSLRTPAILAVVSTSFGHASFDANVT